jgi:multicomponent Na+:H+ antiporter subunit F
MSGWLWSAIGLLPPFGIGLWATAAHGAVANRLVALQLATSLLTALLAILTYVFDQPASLDLVLTLVLLALPGTLVFALFTERWL